MSWRDVELIANAINQHSHDLKFDVNRNGRVGWGDFWATVRLLGRRCGDQPATATPKPATATPKPATATPKPATATPTPPSGEPTGTPTQTPQSEPTATPTLMLD